MSAAIDWLGGSSPANDNATAQPGVVEQSFSEGSHLTLTVVGTLTTEGDPATRSGVLVTIFRAQLASKGWDYYLVRGHAVRRGYVGGDREVEVRIAHRGDRSESIADAWERARAMRAQLAALAAQEIGGAT